MVELKEYQRKEQSTWCPGCGDFAIINGVKKALTELNIPPHQVVLASGVGCFAKLPYWIRANGFVGLHGRSLPIAQGVKLARPEITVLAFGGDGDGYGEGGNHFLHACRRNVNITYLVHNNEVFGLTTGQYSPTSVKGKKSKSSPSGSLEHPVNPLAIAIASGATFVARAYAGNLPQMVEIIKKAVQHKGFALVDILQPCVSFGHNYDFYAQRIYYLAENEDRFDKQKAFFRAMEHEQGEKFPLGIFYETSEKGEN